MQYLRLLAFCSGLMLLSEHTKAESVVSPDSDLGLTLVSVVSDLPSAWALVFDSQQNNYVTLRDGRIRVYEPDGQWKDFKLPIDDLYYAGQGGLLDIKLHPKFAENGWIYVSYSAGDDQRNTLKLARLKLPKTGQKLETFEPVFTVEPWRDTPVHYGARILFTQNGELLLSSGDAFDYREQAQQLTSHLGKILRVSDSGHADIVSYGHRNPQGLVQTANATIIAHEHGPDGGDEINIIENNTNYGWPVATYGKDYIGASISPFTEYPGMRAPELNWTPSIAPSSMLWYNAQSYAPSPYANTLSGLLITTLKTRELTVVQNLSGVWTQTATLFADKHTRWRDIATDQQGYIYLLSDGEPASIAKVIGRGN